MCTIYMKQESFWNICNVRECALNFQNLRVDKPNLKKIWIFVEWKKNILWLDTIQCSKCTTRFPYCVLSYFSLVFVMEQLTNPSYKSQLSRQSTTFSSEFIGGWLGSIWGLFSSFSQVVIEVNGWLSKVNGLLGAPSVLIILMYGDF